MVIAIELYIGSVTRGIIPTIVVSDAINTGRTLETVASTTAVYGGFFSSVCSLFISSTSTIAFFTIIPINPNIPMIAINVIGWFVANSDGTMPQNTNGKHIRMSITFFQLLNSNRSIARIIKMVRGTYFKRFAMASPCNSPSPTHLMEYPAGSSIASMSFFIVSTTFAGVASLISVLGSHSASMTL